MSTLRLFCGYGLELQRFRCDIERSLTRIVSDNGRYTYSRRVLVGLMFSCLGDALLVFHDYFLHGMAAFGIAHLFYIAALGFRPLKLKMGIALYALALLCESRSGLHCQRVKL